MKDDIAYNQIIIFEKNASIQCHQIKKSFIENGKLILILEDSKKITISGKNIDNTGAEEPSLDIAFRMPLTRPARPDFLKASVAAMSSSILDL